MTIGADAVEQLSRPAQRLPSRAIAEDDVDYAIDLVRAICTRVGPGIPGSVEERARAAVLANELEAHVGSAHLTVEELAFAEGFLGSLPIGAGAIAAAALLNVAIGRLGPIPPLATSSVAFALSVCAALLVTFEFVLGREVIDRVLPKKTSVNVVGALRRPDAKEVKRVLIVSGHHDSAPENTWIALFGYVGLFASVLPAVGLVVLLASTATQLFGVLTDGAGALRAGTLGWARLAFAIAPAVIYGLFLCRDKRGGGTVPGAADNLAACGITVSLCRFFAHNPALIPADVEVRFITFGAEEAGLRGSRRYVARHLEELKRLDVRVLNLETVAYPDITILTSDAAGTVKHSPEAVRSAVEAAERAGVPYEVRGAAFGVGTDAAPFSRAGLKATALLPFDMPRQIVAFYHQRADGPEVLSRDAVANVMKLAVEWIRAGGSAR